MGKLEQDIGPVFFPFPGSHKIAPSKREKFQRKLIKMSEANIDIEEFIKGNSILIRDRASGTGYLGKIIFWVLIGMLTWGGVVFLIK